ADRNRSHWSTSKTPSYTKSVSWQHHPGGNPDPAIPKVIRPRPPPPNILQMMSDPALGYGKVIRFSSQGNYDVKCMAPAGAPIC
ncbi:hypothetical protein, partial [Escherichia coli]|uniref:hypothetical protein n=1 Tax=Escherichia coli TaxID=562 RepID=UPI001BC89F1D